MVELLENAFQSGNARIYRTPFETAATSGYAMYWILDSKEIKHTHYQYPTQHPAANSLSLWCNSDTRWWIPAT